MQHTTNVHPPKGSNSAAMAEKRRLNIQDVIDLGSLTLLAHDAYKQKAKSQDAEFAVDRILYGILSERYKSKSKKTSQSAVRQAPVYTTKKRSKRIDFLIGGRRSGTFIELAVRSGSNKQGAYHKSNASELKKLCKVMGGGRYLLIIDTHKAPLNVEKLRQDFGLVSADKGRYTHRNAVVIIYVCRNRTGCHFRWDPDKKLKQRTGPLTTF